MSENLGGGGIFNSHWARINNTKFAYITNYYSYFYLFILYFKTFASIGRPNFMWSIMYYFRERYLMEFKFKMAASANI